MAPRGRPKKALRAGEPVRLGTPSNVNPGDYNGDYNVDLGPREWMHRSILWSDFLLDWAPVKVLGQGGYGIAGLWAYVGDDANQSPKHLVVKQSAERAELQQESHHLRLLGNRSEHVVKLLRPYHEVSGTGASESSEKKWDHRPKKQDDGKRKKKLGRIWLEYCDKGDV